MTDKLTEMLVDHEGLRLKPYRCTAGKLTIGVGRNLDDRGLSPDEALYLLRNDIEISRTELSGAFPWFAKLDPVRQAVLIDMHVNLGLGTLSKFVITLGLIKTGRYDEAASEMLDSAWSRQVGRRARRLAEMMRTGEW
jgi:lysozyme